MKKKDILTLAAIFTVVFLLLGVFLWVYQIYQQKGLSLIEELEGEYEYDGKILYSADRGEALRFDSLGRARFAPLKKESFSLSDWFENGGEYSYFVYPYKNDYEVVYTYYYPAYEGYEPFWPACRQGKLIYIDGEGKKWRIHPEEGLCYPMLADSIEGVDPYGQNILGFSAEARWAVSMEGSVATLYHTDPMDDSLRIVDKKTVDLSSFGKEITFGAFVSETEAYFSAVKDGKRVYFALNAATGETAPAQLSEGDYSEPVSRLYAQRFSRTEKEEKKGFFLAWSHLLLGTEYTSPQLEGYSQGKILKVSPKGEYALAEVKGESGEDTVVTSRKRSVSLSSVLEEGEEIVSLDFVYENVILLGIRTGESTVYRSYKICF